LDRPKDLQGGVVMSRTFRFTQIRSGVRSWLSKIIGPPALRLTSVLVAAAMLCGIVGTVTSSAEAATVRAPSVSQHVYHPTAAQRARLEEVVSTAKGREQLLSAFQHSYGKFARIGLGTRKSVSGTGRYNLSDGVSWDHIWMIASFADVYRGLVGVAEGACIARSPVKWICVVAGTFLLNMTNGHGWTDSHGVWVAYYWWPYLHETGGFW
jgi:hypothetical protein